MKKIFGILFLLVILTAGNTHAQDVSFELSNKKFTEFEGQQFYDFDVLVSSQQSRRLHSGQLYFNYQDDVLGQNLISRNGVSFGAGTEDMLLATESGNPLFKGFILNDNTNNRFSFAWQNNISCDAVGDKSIILEEKRILISFRITLPAGADKEGLDLSKLICFESGELFDNQTYECPGASVDQIIFDEYSCSGPDTIAPVSAISPSTPEVVYEGSVILSWTGTDNVGGSGVASYELYVSTNGGAFELMASDISDTSYVFSGDEFSAYSFYTIAIDNQGNREKAKTTGDVTVYFDSNLGVANSLGTSVTASPNPMKDRFTLKLGKAVDNMEVRVTNIYGVTMFYETYDKTDVADISFQGAAGVYFVKVISGDEKSALFKIVKN